MKLKYVYIVVGIILFIAMIGFLCSDKKKSCVQYNVEFKSCVYQKMSELKLLDKEECDPNTFVQIIDFCKNEVIHK